MEFVQAGVSLGQASVLAARDRCQMEYSSFSYGVLANIGSGAMPGRLPNDGFREASGAGSGQGFKEVLGGFRAGFQGSGA